ncbi:uncharacterized protein LOC113562967 [Ooceraea biroi]|uniref:uncharacterized protein LOC113562967 n=1 Tax=Ooceraea biroi TaxID=2015173 RepID=UPI000F088E4A|nr:uncharacterized protein LOC113562967 [Ooceraea biroi]
MSQEDIIQEHNNKETNLSDLFTSNEILDNIQIFDSTVEVIGFVDGIESPRIVGSNQQFKIFKFYLNNGSRRRIQIVAWNEEIETILPYVIPNKIVHLDGVQTRVPKISTFNNGNMPYELLIRTNTVLSHLGDYEPSQIVNTPIEVKLSDILNISGNIRISSKKERIKDDNTALKDVQLESSTENIHKLQKAEVLDVNVNRCSALYLAYD